MHSLLSRVSLGVTVLFALVLVLRSSDAGAQSASAVPTSTDASQQERASKLTDAAIAAEAAGNYATAIAFYKQAYQLVPHPILEFNIGQVYWLSGDLVQAEKFYRRYLDRDPNGPGASIAREFLDSLRSPNPPNQPATATPRPPQPSAHPASSTSAAISPSAHAREPALPATDAASGTKSVDAESRPQLIPTSTAPTAGKGSTVTPTTELWRAQGEKVSRAKHIKYTGYGLMVVSAALAAAALSYDSLDGSDLVVGTTFGAVAVTFFGGAGIVAYGEGQLRATRRVAWSPAVGPGFAGVALAGSLP